MIEIKATGSEARFSGSRSPGKLDFTHSVVPVEWQIQLEGFFSLQLLVEHVAQKMVLNSRLTHRFMARQMRIRM